jgi:hypothetical protein
MNSSGINNLLDLMSLETLNGPSNLMNLGRLLTIKHEFFSFHPCVSFLPPVFSFCPCIVFLVQVWEKKIGKHIPEIFPRIFYGKRIPRFFLRAKKEDLGYKRNMGCEKRNFHKTYLYWANAMD